MVWIFCDEKTDKELFHYAPNLVDEDFFKVYFEELNVLDELNKARVKQQLVLDNIDKEIVSFTEKINTTQTTKNWNDNCRLKSEKKAL